MVCFASVGSRIRSSTYEALLSLSDFFVQAFDETWAQHHKADLYGVMSELDTDGNGKLDRSEVDELLRAAFKLKLNPGARISQLALKASMSSLSEEETREHDVQPQDSCCCSLL